MDDASPPPSPERLVAGDDGATTPTSIIIMAHAGQYKNLMNTTQCIAPMKIAPNRTEKGKQNREREKEQHQALILGRTESNGEKKDRYSHLSVVFAAL